MTLNVLSLFPFTSENTEVQSHPRPHTLSDRTKCEPSYPGSQNMLRTPIQLLVTMDPNNQEPLTWETVLFFMFLFASRCGCDK